MLRADEVSVERGGSAILQAVSLAVKPGEILAVLGPNGAGKSTLLSVLSGSLTPQGGRADLDGRPLSEWPSQALARRRAVLLQQSHLAFPFRALEVVLLGRSPHRFQSDRARDLALAADALAETGASHLADRIYPTLSGGEQQRVQMARVLVQIGYSDTRPCDHARYLLVDEPTSSLDLAHQHAALRTMRRAAERGIGVLAILHDLNLAAMYADRLALLRRGRLVADGAPDAVMTAATLGDTFDLPLRITRHPTRGCPQVLAL